jgi:hypothetical protein
MTRKDLHCIFRRIFKATRAAAGRNRVALRLERLEGREVPATFTVNTLDDTHDANPGSGTAFDANLNISLRSAIEEANALPGADTINFAVGGGIGLWGPPTIWLTQPITLTITSDIAIDGTGTNLRIARPIAAGTPHFGIFDVDNFTTSSIQGLEIFNGWAGTGGAILNNGSLTLRDVLIDFNQADSSGGGIFNGDLAVLDVIHCTIKYNDAGLDGAGIFNAGTLGINNPEFDSAVLGPNMTTVIEVGLPPRRRESPTFSTRLLPTIQRFTVGAFTLQAAATSC